VQAPESVSALRSAMALDRRMLTMVAHGYTDVVTPYFGTTLLLNQIPDYAPGGRIRQVTYAGGHMFYARDASRRRFRDDVERLLKDAMAGTANAAPGPGPAGTASGAATPGNR
jgi:carboxypeptidase C (cathepsin A)